MRVKRRERERREAVTDCESRTGASHLNAGVQIRVLHGLDRVVRVLLPPAPLMVPRVLPLPVDRRRRVERVVEGVKEEVVEQHAHRDLSDESHVCGCFVEDRLGAKERLAHPKDLEEVDREQVRHSRHDGLVPLVAESVQRSDRQLVI